MVYIRPESTKINEIEYVRVLLKQLISFLENKYLKKYLLELEKNIFDINFVENEIKKINGIIVDSFDYKDEEVKIVLDFIEYLKKHMSFNLEDIIKTRLLKNTKMNLENQISEGYSKWKNGKNDTSQDLVREKWNRKRGQKWSLRQ